jgi:hypothetical protein
MMHVPQPALVHSLAHQRLPGIVQCHSELAGQRRQTRPGTDIGQPVKQPFLISQQRALLPP